MVSKSDIESDSSGREREGNGHYRLIAEVGGVVALVALLLVFVGPALLPGRVLLPLDLVVKTWPPWQQPGQLADVNNPLITDVVDYIFPVKVFTAEAVQRGEWPLWNPYVLGGYPATYNTQAGLYYPLSLFYYLLPAATAVDLTIIVQLVLGGVFMFAFLRQLRLRRLAALLGVVLFLFNGMMVVWLEWQVVHAAVIWLPLQLFFIERLAHKLEKLDSRAAYRSAVWAGMAFAMPWLGGHWNWALYGSMTAVCYGLWRLLPRWRQAFGPTAVFAFVGVGLSMIQVLPAFNYLRQGHRQPLAFADSLDLGLLNRFVTVLLPDFFGNPINRDWWGATNYNETAVYLGVLPLTLALLGVAGWRLRQSAPFFAGWGALGLLWALGTPVYGLLYILPVFDGLWPSRAATVFLFCASVLAAMAVDRLLQPAFCLNRRTLVYLLPWVLLPLAYTWIYRPEWDQVQHDALWWGAGILVTLLFFWLHRQTWLPRVVWALLVLGWVSVDLARAGGDYNTIGHEADLQLANETIVFLQGDPDLFRIGTLAQGVAFPPNSSIYPRLQNMSGYEPAILQRVVDFVETAVGGSAIYFERELLLDGSINSSLIDLLNVKYIVTIADRWGSEAILAVAQPQVDQERALDADTVYYQTLTLPDAGLQRLDLWLVPEETNQQGVTVRVWTADGGQELANASLAPDEITRAGWYSFYFAPFPSEWGRAFRFSVSSAGVTVGSSDGDGYGAGQFFVGDVAQPGDLAFRAYALPRPGLVHEAGKTRVYENAGYFPRAFVVPRAEIVEDEAAALLALQAHQDQLGNVVVLELEGVAAPPGLGTAVVPEATAQVTSYGLNHVDVEVTSAHEGFLVLADVFYPGWRATLDGEETPIYRANSILRAVYVPEGAHAVRFAFWPPDLMVGAALSALALFLALGVLVVKR